MASVAIAYSPRSRHVLSNFSLRLEPGEMRALTGKSGLGKSSVLHVAGLLMRPVAGSVEVGGVDTTQLHDRQRSRLRGRTIGYVFQDAFLDPRQTVLDNVLEAAVYAGSSRGSRRAAAIELMERLGVEVPLERRPGQISGGQAQRIALARALIKQPRVLLADEPTGNLDQESTASVLSVLQEVAATGASVLIATHDRTVISACSTTTTLLPHE